MTVRIMEWFRNNEWAAAAFLALIFLAFRLPAIHQPLHQDEYKWPMIANPATANGVEIPHPPLSEAIYRVAGMIVGYNVNFRFVPLFFGFANLFLLYYLIRFVMGRREAVFAASLFTVSYYSVLASLMVDTDGQILPFFFLLSLIAYFKFLRTDGKNRKIGWGIALAAFLLGGLLVKASFAIAAGAIICDFAFRNRGMLKGKQILKYGSYFLGALMALIAIFLLLPRIFPFFHLDTTIAYWKHFIVLGGRNWGQTLIQTAKAILYTSPLLLLPVFLLDRKRLKDLAVFVIFLALALLFYLVLFDFSTGALDRYYQFDVVPLAVLAGVALSDSLKNFKVRRSLYAAAGAVIALFLFNLQSIPHSVPALYPKSLWLGRLLSLHWNFEFPFTGGSGPLAFYVSFLFMGLTWITAAGLLVWALADRKRREGIVLVLAIVGLSYNFVFAEEYLFGKLNGHAPDLVAHAAAFIENDPDIQKVVVYNDNGGDEIRRSGKYEKRLYTSPDFDVNDKIRTMNAFSGHYLVIDAPPVDPQSVFAKYFATCLPVYRDASGKMTAVVYDCRTAPKIQLPS